MKVCIKAHSVAAFGEIPVGSVWADDSPFIEDEDNFVDTDAPADPDPVEAPDPEVDADTPEEDEDD